MPTAFCPTCVKLSDTKSVGFRSRSPCCLSSSPRHRGALSGGCGASRLPLCAAPVSTYCGGTRCAVVSSSSSSQVSTSQQLLSISLLSFTTSCSAVVVDVDVLVVELAERLKTIQTSMLTDHPSRSDFGGRYCRYTVLSWGCLSSAPRLGRSHC